MVPLVTKIFSPVIELDESFRRKMTVETTELIFTGLFSEVLL